MAIIKGQSGAYQKSPEILAFQSFSAELLLKKWGGVVPEIAARNHLTKIAPLLEETFLKAKLSPKEIDLIGVTTHPGLLGPLFTGLNAAKSLSLIHQTPILGVNHLFAHLEAIFVTKIISYPYLGLLVSGGHSIYFLSNSPNEFEILGSTTDDAAGEAFDKGGRLLGLGYPAGKIIDDLAKCGDPTAYQFPIGLKNSKDASLSYSGVKTSLRTLLEKHPEYVHLEGEPHSKNLCDIVASYQHSIIVALELKLRFALNIAREKSGKKDLPIVVGGGVACNSALRTLLQSKYQDVHFVSPNLCTDNGAMIANFALRNFDLKTDYPEALSLDAKSRFIEKSDYR